MKKKKKKMEICESLKIEKSKTFIFLILWMVQNLDKIGENFWN
jgi:hypothetical protein